MTKQEIQALIDAKIAGQGNQVDSGGALAEILTEINNAAFAGANVQSDWDENDNTDPSFIKNKPNIPTPIVASALPTQSTSQSELEAMGFTESEVVAATKGERNGVLLETAMGNDFYPFILAKSTAMPDSSQIKFNNGTNTYQILYMMGSITIIIT